MCFYHVITFTGDNELFFYGMIPYVIIVEATVKKA